MGGDDLDFADVVKTCIFVGCRKASETNGKYPYLHEVNRKIDALGPTLDEDYDTVLEHAPNAKVFVLGYPYLFPPEPEPGETCYFGGGMNEDDLSLLAEWEIHLNKVIETAVYSMGPHFVYVDPNELFEGHDICSKTPWFNTLSLFAHLAGHDAYLFHPNVAGQAALAQALLEAGIAKAAGAQVVRSREASSPSAAGTHASLAAARRPLRVRMRPLRSARRTRSATARRTRVRPRPARSGRGILAAPLFSPQMMMGGVIGGTVTGAVGGTPVAGVCVTARSSDGMAGYGMATTDAEGHYEVAELPADSYYVEFEPRCYGSEHSPYLWQMYRGTISEPRRPRWPSRPGPPAKASTPGC